MSELSNKLELPSFSVFVETLAKRVKMIAEANPDTIYPKQANEKTFCLYTKGLPTGGCIIGQAIRAEFPKLYQELVEYETTYIVGLLGMTGTIRTITSKIYGADSDFNKDNNDYCFVCDVQLKQDSQQPWGECVK